MGRLLGVLLAFALAVGGCGPQDVAAECAPLARLATPVTGDALNNLQALADEIGRDQDFGDWRVTMIGVDEVHGIISIGTDRPSAVMCQVLHERYGPLIEVIYSQGIELFAGTPVA